MNFPIECLYGALGELAQQLDVPLGYAYPALVTAASLNVRHLDTIRPALYTMLVGRTSSGKGQTTQRVLIALGLKEPKRDPSDITTAAPKRVIITTPNSDRGLAMILENKFDAPSRMDEVLLVWDEAGKVLQKASIEGSSLAPELCTLFTEDYCGGADKKSKAIVENARISILGNLPVAEADDFVSYFGEMTLGGLADRCILAVPEKTFVYRPHAIPTPKLSYSSPAAAMRCFDQVNRWVAEAPETRGKRLGEIMLRVALITASASGDTAISDECLEAARKFIEWQEEIRKVYRPSEAKNYSGEITGIILGAVENIKPGTASTTQYADKLWIHPPRLFAARRLYQKYGAPSCQSCLATLAQSRGVSWTKIGEKLLIGPASYGMFGTCVEKMEASRE